MIQVDISSPETGHAAAQGLRDESIEQTGEEPIEFAQIWSELVEADTLKLEAPINAQSPVLSQSDTASANDSPEVEAIDIQPEPTPIEFGMIEGVSAQSSQSASAAIQPLQVKGQAYSNANQLYATMQTPVSIPMGASNRFDAAQASIDVEQTASPIGPRIEASIQSIPNATKNDLSIPMPALDAPLVKNSGLLQADDPLSKPIATSLNMLPSKNEQPTTSEIKLAEQLPPQKSVDRLPLQTSQLEQHSEAKLPARAEVSKSQQIAAPFKEPIGQLPVRSSLPLQEQTGAQIQSMPSSFKPNSEDTLLPPEPLRTSQSISDSASLTFPKPPVTAPPPLPKTEQSIQLPHGALELEQSAPAPLHVNTANTSTIAAPTSNSYAPQVATQVVAAISQSSNATTEILLNPEELGRVRISLTNGEVGMSVSIFAERAETADLMRRNIELLERELREMGYENSSFTFEDRPGGECDEWIEEHPETNPESPSNVPEQPTPSVLVTMAGGLDLKL